MKRNPSFQKLSEQYLFPKIRAATEKFLQRVPEARARLLHLGIGDTTLPLPKEVSETIATVASGFSSQSGYMGYGPEDGIEQLRTLIAEKIYPGNRTVSASNVFVSDGAKCDLGRLQLLFGREVSVAIQDPTYPVYVDGSLLQGVKNIHLMRCSPENGFFPQFDHLPKVDLIYFCSPNNPTGAVASYRQLGELVAFARENSSIILFDSAYAAYIRGEGYPRSIFEIEGAEEVAIEVGSFSKLAGFTGVRLGWTVVPNALRYESGEQVIIDWRRLISTIFNGASVFAQIGGIAALTEGANGSRQAVEFYLENAMLLKQALISAGYAVFGGEHAPYLWISDPEKRRSSWELFSAFLEDYHMVTTPGVGFGQVGEGFLRIAAFASREVVLETVARLKAISGSSL